MNEETYTVEVTVTDSNGNQSFGLKTEGKRSDLFEQGHSTPGTASVIAYLQKVAI